MSEQPEKPKADPFSQIVQLYDDWTKTWSGTMSQMVSSKSFADTIAQQMEGGLGAATMMRRQLGELMEQTLQQMSLPTRKEIVSLGERMTSIEMRLDDLGAKLDEALDLLKAKP